MQPRSAERPTGPRFPPWLVAPAALALLLAAVALASALTPFPARSWLRHLGVPAQEQPFGDLRVIAAAIDATRQGASPYEPAGADGRQNTYNYPKIWLLLRYAGLQEATLIPWGSALGVLFLATVCRLVRPTTMAEGAYLAILICSPTCLLALERGNSDLLVFIGLAWCVVVMCSNGLAASAVFVAAAAKLFPIGAMVALRPSNSARRWLGLTVVVVAGILLWLWLTRDQWAAVLAITPRIPHWSFGAAVPGQWVGEFTAVKLPQMLSHGLGLAAAGGVVLWLAMVAGKEKSMPPPWAPEAARGLLVGLGVVGFAWVLGNSFQYRLVFLLMCVPALWRSRDDGSKNAGLAARVALALLPIYLWWDFFAGEQQLGSALVKQLVCFILLGALTLLGLRLFFFDPARRAPA